MTSKRINIRAVFLFFLLLQVVSAIRAQQPLNALVNDEGYIQKFGQAPDAYASECDRIIAHLEYVSELLSRNTPDSLNPAQRENRQNCLEMLDAYTHIGQFPENREYPGRRPIFIDPNGTYCAVGYLVAQTAGPAVAAEIDRVHHGDYVSDMDASLLQPWADAHGFTLTELAMIQPTYGCTHPAPNWPGQMNEYLAAAGIACPGVEGPFLIECRFSVSNLKPDQIEFSNQEHPEINEKIEKMIRESTFSSGRCWQMDQQPTSGGPYTLRIFFEKEELDPMRMQQYMYDPRYNSISSYYQVVRGLQLKNEKNNIFYFNRESERTKHLTIGGRIHEDWLGGTPIEGIKIVAYDDQGKVIEEVMTDKNGMFSLDFPNPKMNAFIKITDTKRSQEIRLPIEWTDENMELFFWGNLDITGSRGRLDIPVNLNGC